jgi:hypothetical protein
VCCCCSSTARVYVPRAWRSAATAQETVSGGVCVPGWRPCPPVTVRSVARAALLPCVCHTLCACRNPHQIPLTLGAALSGSSTPPADFVGAVIFSISTRSSSGTSRRAAMMLMLLTAPAVGLRRCCLPQCACVLHSWVLSRAQIWCGAVRPCVCVCVCVHAALNQELLSRTDSCLHTECGD